jgi:hypothetical protein
VDLIALLAAAPPWVRTVASVLIAAWTIAAKLDEGFAGASAQT